MAMRRVYGTCSKIYIMISLEGGDWGGGGGANYYLAGL